MPGPSMAANVARQDSDPVERYGLFTLVCHHELFIVAFDKTSRTFRARLGLEIDGLIGLDVRHLGPIDLEFAREIRLDDDRIVVHADDRAADSVSVGQDDPIRRGGRANEDRR